MTSANFGKITGTLVGAALAACSSVCGYRFETLSQMYGLGERAIAR